MNQEQKEELYKLLVNSTYQQVINFSVDKGYDLDIVYSIIVQAVYEDILNAKLGIDLH